MNDLNTITFIGAGVMAEVMIGGLLAKNLIAPDHITATGPREKRRAELEARYRIRTTADNRAAACASDIIVLCLKPQMLARASCAKYMAHCVRTNSSSRLPPAGASR